MPKSRTSKGIYFLKRITVDLNFFNWNIKPPVLLFFGDISAFSLSVKCFIPSIFLFFEFLNLSFFKYFSDVFAQALSDCFSPAGISSYWYPFLFLICCIYSAMGKLRIVCKIKVNFLLWKKKWKEFSQKFKNFGLWNMCFMREYDSYYYSIGCILNDLG